LSLKFIFKFTISFPNEVVAAVGWVENRIVGLVLLRK